MAIISPNANFLLIDYPWLSIPSHSLPSLLRLLTQIVLVAFFVIYVGWGCTCVYPEWKSEVSVGSHASGAVPLALLLLFVFEARSLTVS